MAQSQNTKVDYTDRATNLDGLTSGGNVMLGDVAFEYYNEKNVEDYIQIPWDEVDYVSASVIAKKTIPRFAIFVKDGRHFTFSTGDNKACLRAIREHVPAERLLRSPSFFQVVGAGAKGLWDNTVGRLGR